MEKHVFLILNFNTKDMTKKLVEYITKQNFLVILVDNGSSDESASFFHETFSNNELVKVVVSSENLGFAKGNNLGYKYIKEEKIAVDYLHCINSDIEFEDLIDVVTKTQLHKDVYIIGPNIVHNGLRTSPMNVHNIKTIEQYISQTEKNYQKKILKHTIASKFGNFYQNHMIKKGSFIQNEDFKFSNYHLKNDEYFILNGAYLIYSKKFIDEYSKLFNDETFLYYEEEILFYEMKIKNKPIIYDDTILVIHNEGVSSGNSVITKYKRLLASLIIFKNIVNDENKEILG